MYIESRYTKRNHLYIVHVLKSQILVPFSLKIKIMIVYRIWILTVILVIWTFYRWISIFGSNCRKTISLICYCFVWHVHLSPVLPLGVSARVRVLFPCIFYGYCMIWLLYWCHCRYCILILIVFDGADLSIFVFFFRVIKGLFKFVFFSQNRKVTWNMDNEIVSVIRKRKKRNENTYDYRNEKEKRTIKTNNEIENKWKKRESVFIISEVKSIMWEY